jgi:Glycosyl hydrolases family 25
MTFPPGFWTATTSFYPDVSNNNWGNDVQAAINFCQQINAQGFAAVCHKTSEGSYFQDPFWQPVKQWCDANDVMCYGYHYVTEDDPAAQVAQWNANNGGPLAMFDWEANGGDMQNFWNVAAGFNAGGVKVQEGYCPQWYWNSVGGGDLSQIPFLIASAYPLGSQGGFASDLYSQCGGDSGEGWQSYGGATPLAWQFTDNATISGISGVDCNAFKGTPQQLQAALGL